MPGIGTRPGKMGPRRSQAALMPHIARQWAHVQVEERNSTY
jgi:hypothetical protein